MDFTSLTSAVDFATVSTGILAVAAASVAVLLTVRGAKTILGFIRGR